MIQDLMEGLESLAFGGLITHHKGKSTIKPECIKVSTSSEM